MTGCRLKRESFDHLFFLHKYRSDPHPSSTVLLKNNAKRNILRSVFPHFNMYKLSETVLALRYVRVPSD